MVREGQCSGGGRAAPGGAHYPIGVRHHVCAMSVRLRCDAFLKTIRELLHFPCSFLISFVFLLAQINFALVRILL